MSIAEALAREIGSIGATLHKLGPAQWHEPTRCPPMDVLDLVGHLANQAMRLGELLGMEPVDEEPEKDAVTYFRYDPVRVGPGVVQRAQQVAQTIAAEGPRDMVRFWDIGWVRALQDARAALPADPVLASPFGLIRLSEYLRTRVLEATVHHMDLDDALGRAPHPDREALEITGDVLRGLLGTDLRPAGMDDQRFALTGTGRAELSDDEKAYLGPLASSFPLLQ